MAWGAMWGISWVCNRYCWCFLDEWLSLVAGRNEEQIWGVPRPVLLWSKPEAGFVKFNVDGSSIGKPGLAGIGGILRDHEGMELIRFSKHIGIHDSNEAELMAVRGTMSMFCALAIGADDESDFEC
ncbi:hypothetical protein PTKIN_Ptkin13bG0142100 [Pterospermum kingtungense]